MMNSGQKRPRSVSPPRCRRSGGGGGGYHQHHQHNDSQRMAQQQVLHEILRRTSLAELRDREIVEWLTSATDWLRKGGADGASGSAELRFLILGVLHTMPWWRVVEGVKQHSAAEGSSSSGADTSAAIAMKAMARWHQRIQVAFENVCLELVNQSQHTVPSVLEVVMKPFHLRPPVRDGALRAIPADTVLRLVNAVATKYSASYVLDLLEQCLSTLMPKRRWPNRRHHVACTAIFLYLALEGHVPAYNPAYGNQQSLLRAKEVLARLEGPSGGGSHSGHHSGRQMSEPPALQLPAGNTNASNMMFGGRSSTLATSEESGTDYASPRGSSLLGLHAPKANLLAGVSEAEASDVSVRLSDTASWGHAAGGSAAAALLGASGNALNNKLLSYRNELIRFVLQRLLEMELTLERQQPTSPHAAAAAAGRGDMENEGTPSLSATSFPVSPAPSSAAGFLYTPALNHTSNNNNNNSNNTTNGNDVVSAHALPYLRVLSDCTTIVYDMLAEDLRRQQTAGVCGNAEWWRELMAFHLNTMLRLEYPVCLVYLAPSLAMLGSEEEPVDMIHKVVTLVIKGVRPVHQQQQQISRAVGAGYPQRVRMAPPSLSTQIVPMAQRIRAALLIYPLFKFMKDRIGNGEGARKRMLKYVAKEMALVQQRSSDDSSRPSALPTATGQHDTVMSNYGGGSIPKLVQVLFAQTAAVSQLMNTPLVSGGGDGDKSFADALSPLISKYELKDAVPQNNKGDDEDACTTRLDLLQMQREGLLRLSLMESCPWAPLMATMPL